MERLIIYIPFVFLGIFYSCSQKAAFPDERFEFSDKYLSLIAPYKIGDTLIFENALHEAEAFVITKLDSSILNEKGWFINARPYKNISLSYNQFPSKKWTHEKIKRDANNNVIMATYEDDDLILLGIDPETNEQSCHFSFKNFRGWIGNGDTLFSTPIIFDALTINKYYKVENVALDLVKNPTDIKSIYITNDKGLVAYQDQKGNWWKRTN